MSDPFPMSSPEAQRLASSNSSTGAAKRPTWSRMNLFAGTRSAFSNSYESGEGSLAGAEGGRRYTDGQDSDDEEEADFNVKKDGFDADPPARLLARLLPPFRALYGDLPSDEILRVLCLSSTLFFMIGGYWLLRSLKDPVLTTICGVAAIPRAKMLSVVVVLFVVFVYNRLLDTYPRHHLFYIFGTFYFLLFTLISILLASPTVGIGNKEADEGRLLGWVSYVAIESFG